MEHRQAIRHAATVPVKLEYGDDQQALGLVQDIGIDGMFIATDARITINRPLRIRIDAPDSEGSLRIPGIVTHRRQNGVGVMFRGFDPSICHFIRRLCAHGP